MIVPLVNKVRNEGMDSQGQVLPIATNMDALDETDGNASTPALRLDEHTRQQEDAFLVECLEANQWGDAMLLTHLYGNRIVFDSTEKQWYLWAGHHWAKDREQTVLRLCAEQLSAQYDHLAARSAVASSTASKEEREGATKFADRLRTRAQSLRRIHYACNVVDFAKGGLTLKQPWDVQRWLLGVRNGVIDLRTGTFRPGRPADYLRVYAPIDWCGLDLPAPRWERFLDEIFEDDELVDYLWRFFGYSITGLDREHLLMVFYGREGRNGKDTLLKTLRFVLGPDLADAVSNDVLLAHRPGSGGAAQPHIAELQGKRLAWCSESEVSDVLSVSTVKQLTGGGAINARRLYQNPQSFEPTHSLVLLTNYRPQIRASKADSIWDRLKVVEFRLRFVPTPSAPNERLADLSLGETLRTEASGILAWLVRGCLEWQQRGLRDEPASVKAALEAYRHNEDLLGRFIEDCCCLQPQAEVSARDIYAKYKNWCTQATMPVWSQKVFGEELSTRFQKRHARAGAVYMGIGLLTNEQFPEEGGGEA